MSGPSGTATGRPAATRGAVAVVVLASAGRPELVGQAVRDLAAQHGARFVVAVCVPDAASLPAGGLPDGVVLAHARGLPAQRNAGLAAALAAAPQARTAFFFDDDSVVGAGYVEAALAFLDAHPAVVGVTGKVLLDGAQGEEVSRERAEAALAAREAAGPTGAWNPISGLYGCNFAIRLDGHAERFDERLPLYAWMEDRDLSERLKRHGALAQVDDCAVVHRGVRSGGRTAHLRLGYSQVMNPVYLHHAGSFAVSMVLLQVVPRLAKNAALSLVRSPQGAWRRRRLHGNALALADAARRRFTPERVLDLPP
ncbi:glycosyltransferase family 2 protein [Quadrisphaera setariae]|uniref:glycosyltransferase family 2 protein n=1 Tax=Quadrisphaera setariae TaxID=2593304 RepID=UPI001C9C3C2D|nr:glycosyltransferase [Quadrisphaera setariae]